MSGFGAAMLTFDTLQTCVFCHTPHGANSSIRTDTFWEAGSFQNAGGGTPMLLWNRNLVNAATTFSLYTSSTMESSPTQVRSYSLLCLTCHDGISAINVLLNQPGDMGDFDSDGLPDGFQAASTIGESGNVPQNIGGRTLGSDTGITDLSNDHPVSINYPTTDAGLATPTLGYVGNPAVRLFPSPSDLSNRISLECSTCHDVHNEGHINNGDYPFLVMSNDGSLLCRQCHLK